MDATFNSIQNYGLHHYALLGDDEGVLRALCQGADSNVLDAAGRTAIMCAVAGENWQNIDACDASFMTPNRLSVLKMLLERPEISLFTLNAPQSSMNGVIPLGMAAWLNQPEAVRTLLEDSAESVSVDGMDSHGATALMYAARDGSLEVVQLLLAHGARPDFRDRNHRTSVQFALAHPRILWLCETLLRRHRWRESKSADRTRLSSNTEHLVELACSAMSSSDDLEPPPLTIFTREASSRLTNALISSIRSTDLAFIHSLLFSPSLPASSPSALYPMSVPVLVNLSDSDGWSPVHHCVAAADPSVEILDALYCAGADISLFTIHDHQTPLHILARFADSFDSSPSLHHFVLHLIQDLRAPLSARDGNDETCIHIAAEHGMSIDLLMLFLDCDTNGTIREMKNARGLTAYEVCKREFLSAFHQDENRSPSALSNYTIRPTDSFASLASISELHSLRLPSSSDSSSIYSGTNFDADTAVHALLSTLRATSLSARHSTSPAHILHLENCLDETTDHCDSIVQHFRGRIEEASRAVQELQKSAERINSVRNIVAIATKSKLLVRGITPLQSKKRQRDSEDSQTTAVSIDEGYASFPSTPIVSEPHREDYVSTGTQTALLDLFISTSISHSNPPWNEGFITPSESTVCKAYFDSLCDVEQELILLQQQSDTLGNTNESPTKLALKLKQALKKKKKLEDKIRDFDDVKADKQASLSGTSRVKAWIKRMVVPHHVPQKLEIVLDLEEEHCHVGREVKRTKPASTNSNFCDAIDASIDTALRTSQIILESAYYDLLSINECLASAERFIDLANHSISRTQRVVKRAVKKREALIADLQAKADNESRLAAEGQLSPGLLGYPNAISTRSSLASISTIYSTTSSIVSVAATLTENDDEDTRIIRRLLLRKIEAQTSGTWDEVDRVTGWLQIVKEAVRGVKRRAYL